MRHLLGVLIGCLIMYALQSTELWLSIVAVCCAVGLVAYIARC